MRLAARKMLNRPVSRRLYCLSFERASAGFWQSAEWRFSFGGHSEIPKRLNPLKRITSLFIGSVGSELSGHLSIRYRHNPLQIEDPQR